MNKKMSLALLLAGLMGSAGIAASAQAQPDDRYGNDRYSGAYDNNQDYNDQDNDNQDNNRSSDSDYDQSASDAPQDLNSQDLNSNDPNYNYNDAQQRYQEQLDQYNRDREEYERQHGGAAYGPPPPPPPRDWRYSREDQDYYHQDCQRARASNQTGGLIIGGLLGAGIGNAVSRGPQRGAGTAVGAVLGGLLGLEIGRNSLNCDDQGYIYRTYYDGFEHGRPGAFYRWHNDHSGNYGEMRIDGYYRDPDGYRCSRYSQTIYIQGHPQEATGHACRQPDGHWVIID